MTSYTKWDRDAYTKWDRDAYIERVSAPEEAERRRKARAVQFVCCITVFLAVRGWFLLRWQVSCTRCVRLLRAARRPDP